jgi:osmoprotectant transport system substrate-binding protein
MLGRFTRRPQRRLALIGLIALLAAGCGGGGGGGGKTIVVGSKLDTEAQILGQLMALQLEAKGYSVRRKIPLGGTNIIRKALTSKRIDVYWEFTGSGLSLLDQKPIGDPQAAYAKVKELDAAKGVTWLPAARLNDTYALAVKGDGPVTARTLSELAGALASQPNARLCVLRAASGPTSCPCSSRCTASPSPTPPSSATS